MATSLTPAPSGATGAPVDPATLNNGAGDAPTDRVLPVEEGTPGNIHEASKALREKLERDALAADAAAATPVAEPTGDRPRNADGTFKAKDGEPVADVDPSAPAPDAAAADPDTEAEPTGEPKVFVLRGETQRGEKDIELDVSGLPAEVVERLERAEKQGMRRVEFDANKAKLEKQRADLDAVETEIAVDTTGFVLSRIPPAKRLDLAGALLLEHWTELAPAIEQLWQDEPTRLKLLADLRTGVQAKRGEVTTAVTAAREAAAIRTAIGALVPDSANDALAGEFYETAVALLQSKVNRGEKITPDAVGTLLAEHRRRYFGADGVPAATTPPARPKLAVKSPPSPAAGTGKQQDAVKAALDKRQAALATAGAGHGAGAVQRPGPPANAGITEASRWLRAQPK